MSAFQAATAESPSAATELAVHAVRQCHQVRVRDRHRSAILPSPAPIPAGVANQTRVPTGRDAESRTLRPPAPPARTAWPGIPKYDVPVAQSRSSGVIGAASTSTSGVAVPGRAAGWSAYTGA